MGEFDLFQKPLTLERRLEFSFNVFDGFFEIRNFLFKRDFGVRFAYALGFNRILYFLVLDLFSLPGFEISFSGARRDSKDKRCLPSGCVES